MFKKTLIFSAIAIALTQATPCFALFLLDDVMSKETQQKTGVANLTPNQKKILESWLNQNFELKTNNQTAKEPDLFLSININAGQKLQLSDGSLWEVSPVDVAQASVWITPFPLRIIPGSDPNYPYLIVNKTSGISINARPISPSTGTSTPQAGSSIIPAQPQGSEQMSSPAETLPGGQVISPTGTSPPPAQNGNPPGMNSPASP